MTLDTYEPCVRGNFSVAQLVPRASIFSILYLIRGQTLRSVGFSDIETKL